MSDKWQELVEAPPDNPNPYEMQFKIRELKSSELRQDTEIAEIKSVNASQRINKLENSNDAQQKEIDKINSNIAKVVWLIITTVTLAILNLVIGGKGQ